MPNRLLGSPLSRVTSVRSVRRLLHTVHRSSRHALVMTDWRLRKVDLQLHASHIPTASTTFIGLRVSVTPKSRKPTAENSVFHCSAVRSLPSHVASMWTSTKTRAENVSANPSPGVHSMIAKCAPELPAHALQRTQNRHCRSMWLHIDQLARLIVPADREQVATRTQSRSKAHHECNGSTAPIAARMWRRIFMHSSSFQSWRTPRRRYTDREDAASGTEPA